MGHDREVSIFLWKRIGTVTYLFQWLSIYWRLNFKNYSCLWNSKSILKQSKSLYAGISISIPVSPVCVSFLMFWFYLCFVQVYFAESLKLSRFYLCCVLFNFSWHLMIQSWNLLGWKRSLSPAENLTLPRQSLNHVPECCLCYVCSTCNRDVNHIST